jgi:KaiC/GvpD/RAD55 family RecA-like ATPase
MSEDLHSRIALKLEAVGPSVSVGLEIKIESYFDVVRGLIDDFAAKRGMNCIYITSSVPSATLNSALQALEANTEGLRFIDCVSHTMMGAIHRVDNTVFVENPSMLENIILKVEYFLRLAGDKKTVVVFDSANSFAIHNDPKMLSEFFTIILNSLKAREAYPVVLMIPDQLRVEVKEMLGMVCDVIMPIDEERQP